MHRDSLARLALVLTLGTIPLATAAAQTTQGGAGAKQLAVPPKLWAAQVSPTEITLTWGSIPGAIAYEIFFRDAKGGTVKLGEAGASATRYVVPVGRLSGVASQAIALAVRAIGSGRVGGVLGWFNQVSLAKAGTGKGALAPTNVRVAEHSPGVITLTWDDVAGATAYAIGRASGTSGFQRLCDLCPVGGRYVDTVPATNVRYVYRIVGLTPSGATRATMSDSIVPTGVIVAGPGSGTSATPSGAAAADAKSLADGATVTARPIGGGLIRVIVRFATPIVQGVTVNLVRRACSGPLQIIRRVADNAPFEIDEALGGLDFPECNGFSKRSISYSLQVSDPKGSLAQSKSATVELPAQEAVATTPPATPTNLRIANLSNGSRILTWDAVAGATSYRIERVVGAKGAWTLVREVEGSAKSYTDAMRTSEPPRYRITAVNAAGASAAGIFP